MTSNHNGTTVHTNAEPEFRPKHMVDFYHSLMHALSLRSIKRNVTRIDFILHRANMAVLAILIMLFAWSEFGVSTLLAAT